MNYLKISLIISMMLFIIMACSSKKEADKEVLMSDVELYDLGNQQLAEGNYTEAIQTYEKLLVNFPTSDLHIDSQLKIASAYGLTEDYEEQMNIISRVLKENIIPGRVPQIYVQLGKFYEQAAAFNPGTVTSDTSDYLKAIKYYKSAVFYKDSKNPDAKAEAAYRRALMEAKIGMMKEAETDYGFVTEYFASSPYATLAKIKLKNINDTSELAMDETAMESYRIQLGEIEMPLTEEPMEEQTVEEVLQQQEGEARADSLFQMVPEDSTDEDL